MKLLFLMVGFLILSVHSLAQTVKYDTLERETIGNFFNAHFLIEIPSENPEDIKKTTISVLNHFTSDGKKLNEVYFWKDKNAYAKMYYRDGHYRTDNFQYSKAKLAIALNQWNSDNWPYMGDNLIAIYSDPKAGIDLFPYRDSLYVKYGGTQKRPIESFIPLQLAPSANQNSRDITEQSGVSMFQLALLLIAIAGAFYVLVSRVTTAKK
ncbi:hypothetical protein [Larkinella rosea]|uniref:Uncharacterized protein n=1 Tax=Larkinella rosea TaxID=2025312 RepID=A0A3P1C2D2_9BACT|nr:hypothetical protein [Larkinella rosea]RRB06954.1 hypothetical protein EHT25_04000 [Larkinella rosea]